MLRFFSLTIVAVLAAASPRPLRPTAHTTPSDSNFVA